MDSPALELIGIHKRFGPVHANRAVDLTVARGSIHGIVGENGAGKSTLMSIVYGLYQADAGIIQVNGRPVTLRHAQDAIRAGIGMVHQHFMLVDTLSVLDNVMLGAEGGWLLARGRRAARRELLRLERDYGLEVDPEAQVGDLPVGLQQRVEILKTLYRGARILILDEPTGVLTPQETESLFRILKALAAQGATVLLITHKLQEIMAVTDRVSVMRQGTMVAHRATAETDPATLAELMVGRKVRLGVCKSPAVPGRPLLSVADLTVLDDAGTRRVDGVSFQVRAGEIVGIAGVSGNGQSELLEALSGIRPFAAGRIVLGDADIHPDSGFDAAALRRDAAAHVPEDRLRRGLVVGFRAYESAALGYHADPAYNGRVWQSRKAMADHCAERMGAFDVRPPKPGLKTAYFSGGNQQKLVLARELYREPRVLLVGQPTRGVDIGAIQFIHAQLIALRDKGRALLLVSSELEEILALSDRILVMCAGRITGELPAWQADQCRLGLLMAGAA